MRRRAWTLTVVALPLALAACASSQSPQQATAQGTMQQPVTFDPKDPLAPTLLMREGQAFVAEGKVEEGLARYRAAVKLQPTNPTIHNLIGQAELRRQDGVKALEAFNQALALSATFTDARNNRGAAYLSLGQYSLAEADFLAALTDNLYANRAGVYYNLGAVYATRGNLAGAEENLRRAATPAGPAEAYALLGQVQERLEKPELAESSYRAAVDKAPERVDLVMLLAGHLDRKGRKDEARSLYRKVLELGPGTPEAAEARALLGK